MASAEEEETTTCKWGPLKAPCCKRLANPKVLLICISLCSIFQGMVVNGFVNVSITSVEKRFSLASSESGLIASSYDIATVICLIPVGHFGGQGSKSRWIGFGLLLLAVGSFVFALPHFISDEYIYSKGYEESYCGALQNTTTTCETNDISRVYYFLLVLGQVFHGFGAAPIFTLGLVFLHESLLPADAAFYMGIFFTLSVVGPAFGYLLGGYFINIYTDFDKVDPDTLDIDPDSEAWVGAWWIGPLICSAAFILISFPVFGLPRRLPEYYKVHEHHSAEVHSGASEVVSKHSGIKSIKSLPKSIKTLVTNPTFIFVSLAGTTDALLLGGFSTFLPKYSEIQLAISASNAVFITGGILLVCGCLGSFLGGVIIKRGKLKVPGIIKFCIAMSILTVILAFSVIIRCDSIDFAGVSVDYEGNEIEKISTIRNEDLADSCNSNCSCTFDRYNPVCGDNGVTYMNPCVAGCPTDAQDDVYSNCTCISDGEGGAKEGACTDSCNNVILFIVFMALLILTTFLTYMPIIPATLRCVPAAQQSLALSLQDVIIRPLGSIPGPIVFGAIFDRTCLFWLTPVCEETEACYYYDGKNLGYYFLALSIGVKSLTILFFVLALVFYKPPPVKDATVDVQL